LRVSRVAVVRCERYEPEQVVDACRRAFDLLGGIGRVIQPGQRVLLKPNLLSAKPPERAVTTHPTVVAAMVRLVREAGAQAWVGDSPGGLEWNITRRVLEKTGVGQAAEEAGAEIKDFDAGEAAIAELPEGVILKRFGLARAVAEADAVITLPKLKTHGQALYTGAVKNLLGCVPGGGKIRMHQLAPKGRELAAALLDIYAAVRPRFALIDAILAMEGNGPGHGDPRHLGLLIASDDAVAADAVACHIIGFPARSVRILRQAQERGLGVGDIKDIEVAGEPLDACVVPDFARPSNFLYERAPAWLVRLIGRAVRVDPEIVVDACRRCGLCQRSCPAHAISGSDAFAIDRAACIRCFCCHELCPHGAVALRRSLLVRLYEAMHHKKRKQRESSARNP
jgi:uncharacterized protein (DUF362 family)/formate hydrogenlyase subunit 6/NADH:ubiquinone oxidoreductase subunit I